MKLPWRGGAVVTLVAVLVVGLAVLDGERDDSTKSQLRRAKLSEFCSTDRSTQEVVVDKFRYLYVTGVERKNAILPIYECDRAGWSIVRLCNPKSDWKSISASEALKKMKAGGVRFFACSADGTLAAEIVEGHRLGIPHLKTIANDTTCDNLQSIPECPQQEDGEVRDNVDH